jgi:hypothetical protein
MEPTHGKIMTFIETPEEIIGHWSGVAAARSFCQWRKRIRKPLTETAAVRVAASLREIEQQGGSAEDALGLAEERGWMTVRPDWYFRAQGCHGNGTDDRTLRIIADAARAR